VRRSIPGPGCAYFLDLDGTLVDLAVTPGAVRLRADLPALLTHLQRASGGALAIISGRAIADLDRLFGGRRYPAAGQHGYERRDARGRRTARALSRHALAGARQGLAFLARMHPGLEFEDKGASLALHYRRAPRHAALARRAVQAVHGALGSRFVVTTGKCVVELTPAGRNKGSAIAAFMRERPFAGRTPIFVGDDRTDEHGFRVVNRLGGCSVKVGRGPTAARWRLPGGEGVIGWLGAGPPRPRLVRRRPRAR